MPFATFAGNAPDRAELGVPLRPVSVSIGRRRILVSASLGDSGRRNGAGKNDAGHHGGPIVGPQRRGTIRIARLPQAAGDQLEARVRTMGPRNPRAGDRRRSEPAPLAVGVRPLPGQDRQLRAVAARSRDFGIRGPRRQTSGGVRSGRARRIPANQEPWSAASHGGGAGP